MAVYYFLGFYLKSCYSAKCISINKDKQNTWVQIVSIQYIFQNIFLDYKE